MPPLAFCLASVAVVVLSMALALDLWIGRADRGRRFRPGETKGVEVMLVLGTAPVRPGGAPNRFFDLRMDAAADLWRTGSLRWVIVSGAEAGSLGDEPRAMREALIRRGVPPEAIYRDPYGVRTLDSVVRVRTAFGLRSVVVVSQQFHVRRALWIAARQGVEAWGWPAADVSTAAGLRTAIRERLARLRAIVDWALRFVPPRRGPRVRLGVDRAD